MSTEHKPHSREYAWPGKLCEDAVRDLSYAYDNLVEQLQSAERDRDRHRKDAEILERERSDCQLERNGLKEQLQAARSRVNWSVGRETELQDQLAVYEDALREIESTGYDSPEAHTREGGIAHRALTSSPASEPEAL